MAVLVRVLHGALPSCVSSPPAASRARIGSSRPCLATCASASSRELTIRDR